MSDLNQGEKFLIFSYIQQVQLSLHNRTSSLLHSFFAEFDFDQRTVEVEFGYQYMFVLREMIAQFDICPWIGSD